MYTFEQYVPDHVSPDLVRDVDIYNIPGGDVDPFAGWAKIKATAPDVFFTPRYGGYWVINRADLFDKVLNDPETFSSRGGAVLVPRMPEGTPDMPPLIIDPPDHRAFRHPYNMALGPKNVPALGARAREVIIECIDRIIDTGECEFMNDVALHVPIAVVMQLFGLPFEDRERLLPMVDVITHSDDPVKRAEAVQGVFAYSAEWVARRSQEPGDDLISKLLEIKVGDRDVTPEEVTSSVAILLLGGLDSVSHSMGYFMRFLADNPGHRQQLIDNPALIPDAVVELLRRHSITTTTRRVTKDVEVAGVRMRAGDFVLVEMCLHGMDPKVWENPMAVDFGRCPRQTMTFGSGAHRCVGINLARAELCALLEEWLPRIPDFHIKPGDSAVTMSGQNIGVDRLPLAWPVPASR